MSKAQATRTFSVMTKMSILSDAFNEWVWIAKATGSYGTYEVGRSDDHNALRSQLIADGWRYVREEPGGDEVYERPER